MKLYDKGRLNLTDRVADYLPWLQDTDKKDITVRQLLLHESGLPSTLLFYLEAIDKESYEGTLFKAKPMPHILHRSVYVLGQTRSSNSRRG